MKEKYPPDLPTASVGDILPITQVGIWYGIAKPTLRRVLVNKITKLKQSWDHRYNERDLQRLLDIRNDNNSESSMTQELRRSYIVKITATTTYEVIKLPELEK